VASRRASDIEAALLRKGFRKDNTHHRYLILYVEDQEMRVRTRISHAAGDYGDRLLAEVRKQLRLSRKEDLLRLVDCPMSGEEYVRLLRSQGVIGPSPTTEPEAPSGRT